MHNLKVVALAGLLASIVTVRPVSAPPAAEVVQFASGRVMSIAGHRTERGAVVLLLRGGGEVRCDPGLIASIELADDVPLALTVPELTVAEAATPAPQLLSRPYGPLIAKTADRHGVDLHLVHALVEVESGYRADAQSSHGAMGLMQLMPTLAAHYGVEDPLDPAANLDAGTRHLRRLIDRFGVAGALAAYNAGEGAVRRFYGIPPYPETNQYVAKIMDLADAHRTD